MKQEFIGLWLIAIGKKSAWGVNTAGDVFDAFNGLIGIAAFFMNQRASNKKHGAALIYAIVSIIALIGMVSLSVDYGRAQAAKTQLQNVADGATIYAAGALASGVAAVQSRVIASVAENKVDGTAVVVNINTDLEFGTWDPATSTFQVISGAAQASATAIRLTLYRDSNHGSPVPTIFAAAIGKGGVAMHASAIATRGKVVTQAVDADSCPWLAGMASGSQVAATGGNPTAAAAPAQSPTQVTGMNINPGDSLAFRQVSGTTSYVNATNLGPDGDTTWIVAQAATNGINTTQAPLNSLVGIFLDARAPTAYAQATAGDFSTPASRDFTTLSPPLKQVFFIGDGMNSSNQLQGFIVPPGATRLYVGIMDEKGWWWDNTGTLNTTMLDDNVQLVQ